LKIVFFGSSYFSVPFLEYLHKKNHIITGVVTNEDKITGRGKKVLPNPVKIFAQNNKLSCLEVTKLDDSFCKKLALINFDCLVIVSFGHIIPKRIIELSNDNAINVHPSLLPSLRGPSPIISALLEGYKETGLSIMKINEELDEGDIYAQTLFRVGEFDNKDILEEKMIKIGAPLLNSVLELIDKNMIEAFPQSGTPSYTPLFKKKDLKIDWSLNSRDISNKIRAFSSEPGAYTVFRDMKVKILSARSLEGHEDYTSDYKLSGFPKRGEIIFADKLNGIIVSCGGGTALKLLELKIEGKDRISCYDFLNGYRVKPGEYFC
jgi:methionyl-tRNA formyltransferase